MKKATIFNRIKTGILGAALVLAVTLIPSVTANAANTGSQDLGTYTVNFEDRIAVVNYEMPELAWFFYNQYEDYMIDHGTLDNGTPYEEYDFDDDNIVDTVFFYDVVDDYVSMVILDDANLSGSRTFTIPATCVDDCDLELDNSYDEFDSISHYEFYAENYYSRLTLVFSETTNNNDDNNETGGTVNGGEDNGGDNNGGNNNGGDNNGGVDDEGTPYGNSIKNLVNTLGTANGTIYFTEGSAIPNRVMKALAENPNASLNFVFEFEGVKYDYLITSKDAAKYYDEKIDWYGHVWLKNHFTNRAKN